MRGGGAMSAEETRYLVRFDMCAEPGVESLRVLVQLCAVAGEDSAVDDKGGGAEGVEVLALVLVDEVLLLGLAANVVGGARLLRDERVYLRMFLRAHGRRSGKGGGDAMARETESRTGRAPL